MSPPSKQLDGPDCNQVPPGVSSGPGQFILIQSVPLEDAQRFAGHVNSRTILLYEPRDNTSTRNIVERISIWEKKGPAPPQGFRQGSRRY